MPCTTIKYPVGLRDAGHEKHVRYAVPLRVISRGRSPLILMIHHLGLCGIVRHAHAML